jgi:hypothetical protein
MGAAALVVDRSLVISSDHVFDVFNKGPGRMPKLTSCRHDVLSEAVAQGIQPGKTMISYVVRNRLEGSLWGVWRPFGVLSVFDPFWHGT